MVLGENNEHSDNRDSRNLKEEERLLKGKESKNNNACTSVS